MNAPLKPDLVQQLEAVRTSPPRSVAPVYINLTGQLADEVRRVALARGEAPQVLAKAILSKALHDGYAEEALAEARSDTIAPGHGRRPVGNFGTMTSRQCAVLYLLGTHGGRDGWCIKSAKVLASMMPGIITENGVCQVTRWLAARDIVAIDSAPGEYPRLIRLTDLGRTLFDELAGDIGHG